ncbi:hypothetical protein [Burkholderia catarinensis]|uniref:hypothetical protein n=1 Tax=Burkholderia catarinensis TaxID=1108140 RepID=UPI0010085CEF|nr:hypothetical protein [Burkholderia catarinensis]
MGLPQFASTLGKQRDALLASDGKQQNDPTKGALAIIEALKAKHPPFHLLLGPTHLTSRANSLPLWSGILMPGRR